MSGIKIGKILLDLDIPTFRKIFGEEGNSPKITEEMVGEEKRNFSDLFKIMVTQKSLRRKCNNHFKVTDKYGVVFLVNFVGTINWLARLCTALKEDVELDRLVINNYQHGFIVSVFESPSEEVNVKRTYIFEPIGTRTYRFLKEAGLKER